jgi:hypothetical protein
MLARNEEWIIGLSARAALKWFDNLIVFDHASADNTASIIKMVSDEHPGRLIYIRENNQTWYEMAYRQRMLDAARGVRATHIATVDADEVLCCGVWQKMLPVVESLKPGEILSMPLLCMWRSINKYRDDNSKWSKENTPFIFRDAPGLYWRSNNGYDFHHRQPYGSINKQWSGLKRDGSLMHLQFVDWERLKIKHVWYKMVEVIRWPGREPVSRVDARYSKAVDESGMVLAEAKKEWWECYGDIVNRLQVGHVPWHLQECREMMRKYGRDKFNGLNLWGVV